MEVSIVAKTRCEDSETSIGDELVRAIGFDRVGGDEEREKLDDQRASRHNGTRPAATRLHAECDRLVPMTKLDYRRGGDTTLGPLT